MCVEVTLVGNGEGKVKVGTEYLEIRKGFGRSEWVFQVIEYEPSARAVHETVSWPIHAVISETFESTEGGTLVTIGERVQPSGLLKLAQPLLGRVLKKWWRGNLTKLQRLLEESPA